MLITEVGVFSFCPLLVAPLSPFRLWFFVVSSCYLHLLSVLGSRCSPSVGAAVVGIFNPCWMCCYYLDTELCGMCISVSFPIVNTSYCTCSLYIDELPPDYSLCSRCCAGFGTFTSQAMAAGMYSRLITRVSLLLIPGVVHISVSWPLWCVSQLLCIRIKQLLLLWLKVIIDINAKSCTRAVLYLCIWIWVCHWQDLQTNHEYIEPERWNGNHWVVVGVGS